MIFSDFNVFWSLDMYCSMTLLSVSISLFVFELLVSLMYFFMVVLSSIIIFGMDFFILRMVSFSFMFCVLMLRGTVLRMSMFVILVESMVRFICLYLYDI